jgi:hypothetical protein
MTTTTDRSQSFTEASTAFAEYVQAREHLATALARVGIRTPNVDPLANFAEVLVAQEFDGDIQPPANKGFDVLTRDGCRIQVKTLRVTSGRPLDNGRGWVECTRNSKSLLRIEADKLAIVVFVDFRPYALAVFPIEDGDCFPVLGLSGLALPHIDAMLNGKYPLDGGPVSVKRLTL